MFTRARGSGAQPGLTGRDSTVPSSGSSKWRGLLSSPRRAAAWYFGPGKGGGTPDGAGAMLPRRGAPTWGCFPQGTLEFGGSLCLVLLSGWTVSPGDLGWGGGCSGSSMTGAQGRLSTARVCLCATPLLPLGWVLPAGLQETVDSSPPSPHFSRSALHFSFLPQVLHRDLCFDDFRPTTHNSQVTLNQSFNFAGA